MAMKNKLTLFLSLAFSFSLFAQENWVSYSQAIKTGGHEGRRFRLEASVRAEVEDDSASARLWARVDKPVGVGFFDNMWLKPVRNRDWKTYTIEGTIDTGAYQIAFGALCQYNGKFYYDDFKIQVEDGNGGWTTVFTENFEQGNSLAQGIRRWEEMRYGDQENYRAEVLPGEAPQGKQFLLVQGQGIPNYGINNKAGKYASVNGIQLYYEVYGEGQPLVVLHGNGGSMENGTSHYPHFLGKNYKLILVDSRAQGRSGDTDAELTYELLASDVNELLNQLDIDSTYIWGHSDGAILGLIIAKNYPDKVKKLVAFAANVVPDTTGIEAPIYQWIERQAKDAKTEKERKLATMMWKHPNIPFSELVKIQAEVLVMSGDRDFVPLAHTLEIFRHIPKAQLCVIPGSTHGAAWEKKELFQQLVDEFFEKPFAMPNTVDWFKN
jgi:pimeloyl-ACP methyl ester carboxylesterase